MTDEQLKRLNELEEYFAKKLATAKANSEKELIDKYQNFLDIVKFIKYGTFSNFTNF